MDRSKNRLAPALAVVGILLALLLAIYVSGYFAVSDLSMDVPGIRLRKFNAEWQAAVYQHMAWLEWKITGDSVEITW